MNKKQFLATAAVAIAKKSNPLEKNIEKKIGQYAKSKGCEYIKFTSPQRRAVPDRMIIAPSGNIGFLEIKRKGEKPTPLQTIELRKLERMNCNVGWCDDVERGKMFISMLTHPDKPAVVFGLNSL